MCAGSASLYAMLSLSVRDWFRFDPNVMAAIGSERRVVYRSFERVRTVLHENLHVSEGLNYVDLATRPGLKMQNGEACTDRNLASQAISAAFTQHKCTYGVIIRSMISKCIKASIVLLVLTLAQTGVAQSDKVRCETPRRKVEYKLLTSAKTISSDKTKLIHVLVKPRDINSERLRLLATRLRRENCGENRLLVVIFDNRERYQDFLQLDYYFNLRKRFVAERGYYSFDSEKGEELLEFSLTPGKPTTEVQIDLAKEKSAIKPK